MIQRNLNIGRWHVEFYFCTDGYDIDYLLDRLYFFGASVEKIRRAWDLMENGGMDKGYTFTNSFERTAIVVIGPTSSGKQFQNSLSHELRHLVNGIAASLGIPLDSEPPSYLEGDSMMELADVVCRLGCDKCRE